MGRGIEPVGTGDAQTRPIGQVSARPVRDPFGVRSNPNVGRARNSVVQSILVLRHGETTWNTAGRWQGWIDIELSDTGIAQANARAETLADAGITFGTVVSSDLARAARTAEIIADRLAAPAVERHWGLRERCGGEFEGLDATAIDAGWPGFRERWRAGLEDAPPGGESDDVLWERVRAVLRELHDANRAGPILVVTHGGVARVLSDRSGCPTRSVIPNVGGRWYDWDGHVLIAGDALETIPDTDRTKPAME